MNGLSPETRGLLASLAPSHDPPPDAAPRVRERVAARVAATPSTPPRPVWLAWVGAGVSVLALAWWATRAPAPVAPPPSPRPTPSIAAPIAPPVIAAPSPSPPPSPTVIAAPPPAPRVVAPPVERDDLPAELRWIESAQTALAADDLAAARAALRGHARAFPHGHLSEEREALGVQVLCASGRADEARLAAAAFVARHPTSPQAARVRRTCVDAP